MIKILKNCYFISFFCLLLSLSTYAQWRLNHIGGDEGLSHNRVSSIIQDRQGYLWFGTYNGVNQYDGYSMKEYNYAVNSVGLTSNIVLGLFEDKDGFIWVSTRSGLNRIDTGTDKIINYFKGGNGEKPLRIHNIHQSKSGTFVINTPKSIKLFEVDKQGQLEYDAVLEKNKDLGINIKRLAPGLNGEFWAVTSSGRVKLHQLDIAKEEGKPKVKITPTNFTVPLFRKGLAVLDIVEYPKNTLWMVNNRLELLKLKLNNDLKVVASEKIDLGKSVNEETRSAQRLIDMVVDDKNRLWFGGNKMLLSYDMESGEIVNFTRDTEVKKAIGDTYNQRLFIDNSNVLWVCTANHGLYKLDLDSHTFYNSNEFLNDKEVSNLFKSSVITMCEGQNGAVWFGTQDGAIIALRDIKLENNLNSSSNATLVYSYSQKENNTQAPKITGEITRLKKGKNGTVWVGTTSGLRKIQYHDASSTYKITPLDALRKSPTNGINNRVFAIEEDRYGNVWYGSWGAGLVKMTFDTDKESYQTSKYSTSSTEFSRISNNNIRDIVEDEHGDLWIGTSNGLNRIKYTESDILSIEKFYSSEEDTKSLSNDHILDIYEAKNGVLYVGTSGGGLNRLNYNDSGNIGFMHYTVENGLPSNVIYQIREDAEGNIWLMHARKISKLIPSTGEIIYFEKGDGFDVDEFRDSAMTFTSSGILFCGGVNGFTFFQPNNIQVNKREPQVTISDFKLFNESIKVGEKTADRVILEKEINDKEEIELPHDLNSFEFVFSSMHFSNPEKNKYKFILEGFEEKPQISVGKERRFASYTNIPPGKYVFKVSGSNSSGVWSAVPKEIKITITPPWYLTPLAILFFILTVILIVYIGYRIRWHQIKLKNDLRLESALHEKSIEINQMKLRFFTNISHELRTPLTLIIGPLQQILEGSNDAEYLKRLNGIMYKNSTRLLRLINQLLDFRKVESGTVSLIVEEGDLADFIKEIYNAFKEIADERQIEFKFGANQNAIRGWFDNDKIEKIIYNLLSNAFKFTPANRKIEIVLEQKKIDNKEHAIIKVMDEGIGIESDDLPSIFERFYQSKNENDTLQTGTGLGLAYTRRLVEMHNGTIEIASVLNEGTVFTISIPLSKTAYEDTAILEVQPKQYPFNFVKKEVKGLKDTTLLFPKTAVNMEHSSDTPTVLIVEDNVDLQEYLSNYFKKYYHVLNAPDGEEGLRIALEKNPDLIISDLMMKKMGGIEMCKIIKNDIKTSHIPVLILTAKSGLENEKEGLETGADEFVLKPFNIELLRLRVANILKTKKQWAEKFKTKPTASAWKELSSKLDKDFLKKSLKIIKKNIDNTEYSVEQFALDIGMSRSALHKKFKAITGQSTTEFIRAIRVKRAATLMKTGKYSITEIVFMVGFSDPKHFRSCFKKQFGQTPTQFIKNYKEMG